MRFLMFNICVLACLGYLFTASPDQSFSSWLTGTSKTVVAGVDQVMQEGKDNIDHHGLAETASELMAEITTDVMVTPSETEQLREDILSLKAEVSSLNALLEDMQTPAANVTTVEAKDMIAPLPNSNVSPASVPHAETNTSKVEPVILVEQSDPPVSDIDIANAFAELAEADQENMVAPGLDTANVNEQMRYMTPAERQQDLGKLMLDMQVFYLEKSGI